MVDPTNDKISEETVLTSSGERGQGHMPLPYLIIADGPRRGSRFPLHEGENIIGRAPGAQVLLEDQSVSRRHCAAWRADDDAVSVRDLESKNGTNINDAPVTDTIRIGHGDLIQIGIYTLRLISRAVSDEEAMAPLDMAGDVPEEHPTEEFADTATLMEDELVAEDEDAVAEEDDEDDELEGKTMVALPMEAEGDRGRRRLQWLVVILVTLGLGVGGYYAYLAFFAVPPAPSAKMVARVIPQETAVAKTAPDVPTEIPIFVDFAAQPLPARVAFQEKDYGLTPIKVNTPLKLGAEYTAEGRFALREFNEEYVERVTFTVEQGESLIPVFFRAPIGVFKVEKLPREVELTLYGYFAYDQFTKRTATLGDISYGKPMYLPYGRYVVELRRQREISESGQFIPDIRYRREILLGEDVPTYALTVEKSDMESFPVDIRSTPSKADIFIDTKPAGKTPYVADFPLGEHTLIVRKEGYLEETRALKNDINTPVRLDITLKTTAAGGYLNDGRQLVLRGLFKDAVAKLSEVFEKGPSPVETAQAQYLLGTAFLGLGDLETSKGYFQQAQANAEYEGKAKLGIVRILHRQQKRLEAIPILVDVMLRTTDDAVKAEAQATFKEVSPLKSVMYVRTEPMGATVFVNDEPMKMQTPVILHDLGIGNYRMRVELDGYKPQSVNVNLTVHEFNPIIIKLEKSTE